MIRPFRPLFSRPGDIAVFTGSITEHAVHLVSGLPENREKSIKCCQSDSTFAGFDRWKPRALARGAGLQTRVKKFMCRIAALAAGVMVLAPQEIRTFFVTSVTDGRRALLQSERMAKLFLPRRLKAALPGPMPGASTRKTNSVP